MSAKVGSVSLTMAMARVAVGIMFLFFAQYKLMHKGFAHGGYQKYVTGYAQETSVYFYRPFLNTTLKYPVASAYTVAVTELLIGLSMVMGLWVRQFGCVGALFMLNLALATWRLPPGTEAWRYLGNQLDTIPLMMLFIIFVVHNAGETLGLDKPK